MKGQFRIINSRESLEFAIQQLREEWESSKWLMMQTTNEKQRSQLQNNSLHLWCDWVAKAANDHGYDVRRFLVEISKRLEIPWRGPVVKELIWRPVQESYTAEQSTTKPSTTDFVLIYEIINKAMGESMGIHVPWPNKNRIAA